MPKKKKKIKRKKKPSKKRKTLKKRKVIVKKSFKNKFKIKKDQKASSELIFKTKKEWIKNSLANKSQYQNKYNDQRGFL